MEMLTHHDLFSVRVTQAKFPVQIDLLKKIHKHVDENFVANEGRFVSNYFGYQYHDDFEGKKELDETLNNFSQLHLNLNLRNAWLNVLQGDAYNTPHYHEGNTSAVLYLSENNNNITFVRDDKISNFKPKMFDLLIFPANLVHYVLPTENKDRRISYAMNLVKRK